MVESTTDQYLQLGNASRRQLLPLDSAPGSKAFLVRGQCTQPRLDTVRNNQRLVEHVQRRKLSLVGLQLLEGTPDGGVLGNRVLQLDNRQRQPIDEHHDIRTPSVPKLRHSELVDDQPVVVLWRVVIKHPYRLVTDRPIT